MNQEIKLKLWHVLISVIPLTFLLYFIFIEISPTQVGDYSKQEQKIDSLKNIIIKFGNSNNKRHCKKSTAISATIEL